MEEGRESTRPDLRTRALASAPRRHFRQRWGGLSGLNQTSDFLSLDDGMSIASRYFATVLRATLIP